LLDAVKQPRPERQRGNDVTWDPGGVFIPIAEASKKVLAFDFLLQ
jgi:hypothetical protein